MIIEPKIRNSICLTAHPDGCEKEVLKQIEYVKSKGKIEGVKNVLVIGSSTGYGLACRISAAFGCGASTIGVFFEKEGSSKRPGTPGYYNSRTFDKEAEKSSLYTKSINGDAFSKEIKDETIKAIKEDLGKVDLVIYSLASGIRTDPSDGITYRSSLKPIGSAYKSIAL
ncbi:MAG: bifunctional NADH-specific enoyl-ACP reductase/trans-2-enoyl-CoA reductase, partial [Spirochaetales bacterium]|nr:bifunctional NADH-specific enoyl-ACP reductase/trans-2-enoyl-CoA reductase [Spirochaetales bacterium]